MYLVPMSTTYDMSKDDMLETCTLLAGARVHEHWVPNCKIHLDYK